MRRGGKKSPILNLSKAGELPAVLDVVEWCFVLLIEGVVPSCVLLIL